MPNKMIDSITKGKLKLVFLMMIEKFRVFIPKTHIMEINGCWITAIFFLQNCRIGLS